MDIEQNENEEVVKNDPNAETREEVIQIILNAFKQYKATETAIRKDVYAYWERSKGKFSDSIVNAVEENPTSEGALEGLRMEMKEAYKSQRFALHSAIFLVNYQRSL